MRAREAGQGRVVVCWAKGMLGLGYGQWSSAAWPLQALGVLELQLGAPPESTTAQFCLPYIYSTLPYT